MRTSKSYIGELDGVKGIWCGKKPKGIKLEKEVEVYYADEGKVFSKGDEIFDSVILKDGEKIEDYQEIDSPKGVDDADKSEEVFGD